MKADVKKINQYLSRDLILGAQDIKRKVVDVPEWGGKVLIQSFNGLVRNQWLQSIDGKEGDGFTNERLIIASVIDEDGNLIFSDSDIEQLKQKSARAIGRIANEISKLNGLTADAVEDAEKN